MSTPTKLPSLSDITTSETNLSRLSCICEIVGECKGFDQSRLYRAITDGTSLTNGKVIARHLHILRTLGFIENNAGKYFVTSRGKVLVKVRNKSEYKLTPLERILFFRSFFTSIPDQLLTVISVIGDNKSANYENNIVDYYKSRFAQNSCFNRPITLSSQKIVIKKSMADKVKTMIFWLITLELLGKNKFIWLTEKGARLYRKYDKNLAANMINDIFYYCAELYGGVSPEVYDFKANRSSFIRTLREANLFFKGQQEVSDIVAIQEYVSTLFASRGIILNERAFYSIIQELGTDGTIRSVIVGREGKLAFLVMD